MGLIAGINSSTRNARRLALLDPGGYCTPVHFQPREHASDGDAQNPVPYLVYTLEFS